jgi:uncharacterized membrane protein YdjX (TVP38/TMEM64 family)
MSQPSLAAQPILSRMTEAASTFKRLGPTGLVATAASFLPGATGTVILVYLPTLGDYLRDQGPVGAVLAGLSFVILGAAMLAPTFSFAALCGWSFGLAWGFPTALLAIVLAGYLNYVWVRLVARDRITDLLGKHPKADAVHKALLGGTPGKTICIVTLLRLPPGFPFALGNVLLAATKVPLSQVMLGTFVGMIPRTFVVVSSAAVLSSLSENIRTDPLTRLVWIALALLSVAVIGWIGMKSLDRVTSKPNTPHPPPPQNP